MVVLEGDCVKDFDLLNDEKDLDSVGAREIVVGVFLFTAPFATVRLLTEDNCLWEDFRELRDREDFNRDEEEVAFSEAKTFPTFLTFVRESVRAAAVFWLTCLTAGLMRGRVLDSEILPSLLT